MKRAISLFLLAIVGSLEVTILAACGGGMNASSGTTGVGVSGQAVPASFSISDTAPQGVIVLRFQIDVTAAALQPSSAGEQPVSMLPVPATVELIHLQSESALLANFNVPAGTYTSLTASFANPRMTILNQSNMEYTVGGVTCQPTQVCTLTPTLNQSTVTDEAAPFPITLSSSSPVAFLMHFDVNASVQGDLSVSPTISLKELPPLPSGALEQFHVIGRITGINAQNSTFTLQTGFGNLSLTISTTSSTQYDFGSVCAADTFSCLMKGEVVRVGLSGMPGGTLVATNIDLITPQFQPVLEGVVIGVDTAKNQAELVLIDFQDDTQGDLANGKMAYGLPVTVQLSNTTTFKIDTDGITLPSTGPALSFASVNDMIVGQSLAVQPVISSIQFSGTPPSIQITFTASSVRLESSEVTATVDTVNPPSFTLQELPALFTSATPAITELDVETVAGTNFENVSGVSALAGGDKVSVGGLLFNTASVPTVVAERVLLR
ncbi:MAG TPA: DUF5666 domain-containing protein [Candidatus Acidoferrum sp.]|nr:DUF5666 domain-containing protein [Candidatus Acidoferrum sp.]